MAVMSESDHQVLLFRWAYKQAQDVPELAMLHHVPNGGDRSSSMGARLQLEGVKAGVPDLVLPVARKGYHGLYVELKTDRGTTSPKQDEWLTRLNGQGYCALVARGAEAARSLIVDYLGISNPLPLPVARIAR